MRLLHVASSYPLSEGDEHAPFMEEMLEALADRGHEVTVLVPRVDGLVEGLRNGVDVVGVAFAPSRMQVWGYGRSLDAESRLKPAAIAITPVAIAAKALALRKTISALGPDVVHLHWLIPQGVLSLVVPRRIPVVVSLHGADARYATGSLAPLTRRVIDRAGAVIAASAGIIDLVSRVAPRLRDKAVVIPHGANETLFYPRDRDEARSQLGIAHDAPIILGVGRLVPKKGFRILLEAMPSLLDTGAHLYLIGDGPEKPGLEEAIAPETRPLIHFVGRQSRNSVADWIAASDVVVIPSVPDKGDIDTGPVVLMEALASGRPVVSTRVGMAPDVIVDQRNGLLVDRNDGKAMAAAIRQALRAPADLGSEAQRTFRQIGDWSRVAHVYEETYLGCCRQAASSPRFNRGENRQRP